MIFRQIDCFATLISAEDSSAITHIGDVSFSIHEHDTYSTTARAIKSAKLPELLDGKVDEMVLTVSTTIYHSLCWILWEELGPDYELVKVVL